jgi:anti-sigma factor RsiW
MADFCRSDDALQAWIAGELDAHDDAALEHHVGACEACARKLHELAALDQLMRATARTIATPRRPLWSSIAGHGPSGGRGSLPGAFAVAAALVLGLRLPSPWHAEASAERGATVEICAEPEASACTSPIEPGLEDDALATFPDDEAPAPRGLCIAADEWPDAVCIDGEILAG